MVACSPVRIDDKPSAKLRELRKRLALSLRDVHAISQTIAACYDNSGYVIHLSRLSEYETRDCTPSPQHLYVLSVCYRTPLLELLAWYVPVGNTVADWQRTHLPRTHSLSLSIADRRQTPHNLEQFLDGYRSTTLGKLIAQWGLLPLGLILRLTSKRYSYAYVGAEDFTMYPLLPPGSFIQVDERRNKPTAHHWNNEYERPIYLVETRDGLCVSWCDLNDGRLVLQPHSLSPVPVRIYRHPNEAQIIGQVVGISIRVNEAGPESKATRRI